MNRVIEFRAWDKKKQRMLRVHIPEHYKVDPSVKTLREAVLRATLLLFFLKTHGFNAGLPPVSENTLQLGFGTPVLDEAACDCKIRNSSAIGSVPLSVRYTHADRLLHI